MFYEKANNSIEMDNLWSSFQNKKETDFANLIKGGGRILGTQQDMIVIGLVKVTD